MLSLFHIFTSQSQSAQSPVQSPVQLFNLALENSNIEAVPLFRKGAKEPVLHKYRPVPFEAAASVYRSGEEDVSQRSERKNCPTIEVL